MKPCEIPLEIFRDATFDQEFITQVKTYNYDPDINVEPADQQRTYAENLEHHGYTWQFVDFATTYASAELIVLPAYTRTGDQAEELLKLTSAAGDIELGARSVKVGLLPTKTAKLSWNEGKYKLKLITASGKVDFLSFGSVKVLGEKA